MATRAARLRFQPEVVLAEDRMAPALFTVNVFTDSVAANPADGSGLDAAGKISLRSAVQASAFTTGGDTIVLQTGTYQLTLSGAEEDDGVSGDLDIRSGTVTIQGAGSSKTIVAAQFSTTGRVLHVNTAAVASAATTVTLTGLTVTGGNVDQVNGFSGGGIQNEGGVLSLTDVAVTGNKLVLSGGGDARGGGILSTAVGAYKGDVTLTDSVVSNNSVSATDSSSNARGGGIYNSSQGALTLIRTRVEGNTATGAPSVGLAGPGSGAGAGVYDEFGGTLTITNSTFADNKATGGAASYATQNVYAAFGQGAAVYADFGTVLTVTGSTFARNIARGGDAVYTGTDAASIAQGGNGEGGAFYVRAAATVRNSTFSANEAVGGAASGALGTNIPGFTLGGAISFAAVTAPEVQALTNSTVTLNKAAFGGGVSSALDPGPSVQSTIIAGNIGQDPDVEGKFVSAGNNLIGNNTGSDSFSAAVNDQVGTAGNPIPAGLAPLGNYGGPTQTHALLNGSAAINAGAIPAGVTLTTDQRGFARVVGGQADVGSVEFAPPVAVDDLFTATAGVATTAPAPGVLANDTNPMGTVPLTAVKLTDPAHGVLTFIADGSFTYTAASAFKGTDTFTYQAVDAAGNASTAATVSINVELPPPPPPNTAPTISDVANQTSPGGGTVGPLTFTVGDAETPAGSLTVTAASSNTALVPLSGIALGGSGANRTVTVTPAAGQSGTAIITLTVQDANGATAADTFTLTVPATSGNTPPTISDVADRTSPGGGTVGPLAFTVGDAETPAGSLTVTAASSNTALVPLSGIALGGSGANRTVTVTPAAGQTGTAIITLTVQDANGATAADTFTVTVPPAVPPIIPPGSPVLVGGANGSARLLTQTAGVFALGDTLTVFSGFAGSVRTAVGDVNGDGVADLIAGTGPGTTTRVVVLDGKTRATLFDVSPFEASFTGGVYVAVTDLNRDGHADVIVTPDEGGGPRTRIYSGAGFGVMADYLGIDDANFRGGARASAGDVNGDGVPDVVVAAGFLGGPRITVWDGVSVLAGKPAQIANFFAFETRLRNGAFVSAGDVDGDGIADLAFGGGPGGGPRVRIVDGADLMAAGNFGSLDSRPALTVANFFAGDVSTRGGIRISLRDFDGDAKADLVTGSGDGVQSAVRLFSAAQLAANPANPSLAQPILDPFGAVLANGVFVG